MSRVLLNVIAVVTLGSVGLSGQPVPQDRWKSVKVGDVVPGNAIIGSVERNGEINYICRGMKAKALHAGKGVLRKCLIAYGQNETETEGDHYQVLIGSSPRWDRYDENSKFLLAGYEHRGPQKHDTYACLAQFIANAAPLGKILPFDDRGTCHVPAGGSAYKSNDRNKFVALTSVAVPLAEDTPNEAYLFGTEESRTADRIEVSVWDGSCHTYDFGGRKAIRVLRAAGTNSAAHGSHQCNGKAVRRYAFPPGNLLR